jgi:hypothetical protein
MLGVQLSGFGKGAQHAGMYAEEKKALDQALCV